MKKISITIFILFLFTKSVFAQDPYLGEIKLVGYNFEQSGWLLCQGQTLSIAQYSALFAVIGTNYGGDGVSTFNIPDLRGRAVVGIGSSNALGQVYGSESKSLTVANLPAHNHGTILSVNNGSATANVPTTASTLANDKIVINGQTLNVAGYSTIAANTPLLASPTSNTGSGTAFNTMQPFLTMNYMIAVEGIFPTQN